VRVAAVCAGACIAAAAGLLEADDKSGAELERLVAAVRKHDIDVHADDTLKKAPPGYPADHPRIDLLRYKGLMAWKEWPVEPWLGTAAAKDRVVAFLTAAQATTELWNPTPLRRSPLVSG